VKSVLLDGEGIVYDQHSMPSFDLIHSKQYDREVSLVAFDLLELDADDVRKRPLVNRKGVWLVIAKVRDGIEFAEHIEGDGADIFRAPASLVMRASSPSGKTCPTNPSGRSVAEDQEPRLTGRQAH
jgi:ATP-dependent DNA ligase